MADFSFATDIDFDPTPIVSADESITSGTNITRDYNYNSGGAVPSMGSNQNSVFKATIKIPTGKNPYGCIFEMGSNTKGGYCGFNSSSTLIVRMGDGKYPPGGPGTPEVDVNNYARVEISTASLPQNVDFDLMWEFQVEPVARVRVWVDNVLVAEDQSDDGSPMETAGQPASNHPWADSSDGKYNGFNDGIVKENDAYYAGVVTIAGSGLLLQSDLSYWADTLAEERPKTISGTADVDLRLSHSVNGGISIGGQAEISFSLSDTSSGGVVISGQSSVKSSAWGGVSSGGISVAGESTALDKSDERYVTASGGVSVSGTSAASITELRAMSQGSLIISKDSYVDIVSGSQPIAYWKLDESSGASVAENYGTIGTAVDGTYKNFVTTGEGGILQEVGGFAAEFDGVNDYVSIPANDLIGNNPLAAGGTSSGGYPNKSVEIWFQAYSTYGRRTIYCQGGGTRGLNIYILDGILYVYGYNNGGAGASQWEKFVSAPVDAGGIYHVVLTFDNPTLSNTGGQLKGYLNGEEIGSESCGQLRSHTQAPFIGGTTAGVEYHDGFLVGNYFNGKINHLSLQNATLSATEVRRHYSAGVYNFNMILDGNPSGGLVADGGEPAVTLANRFWPSITYRSSNPFILSGESDHLITGYRHVSEGGITLGGSYEPYKISFVSSGGLVLSGDAVEEVQLFVTGSGGVSISGEVDITPKIIASGGLTLRSPRLFTLMASESAGFWPLDEGSGTVAKNRSSSGSAENGIHEGNIRWSEGLIPTESPLVRDFQKIPGDDRVERSDGTELRASGDKSIELWVSPNSLSGRRAIYTAGNAANGFNIYLDGSSLYAGAWDTSNSWQAFINVDDLELGEIYHVVLTFLDSTSFRLYLNGTEVGSDLSVGSMSIIPVATGYFGVRGQTKYHDGDVSGIGNFFEGRIGYIASYNIVLSQSDIETRQSYTYFPYGLSIPAESDGGITLSGSSDLLRTTGVGVAVSGESDYLMSSYYLVEGSGGLILSGDSEEQEQYFVEGSGGIALSGSSDLLRTTGVRATVSGESVTISGARIFEGSGGLILSGDSEEQEQYFVEGSGGVTLSGSYEPYEISFTSGGGVITSGESDAGMTNTSVEGSGGLILRSTTESKWQQSVTGSGGITIGGGSDAYVSLYIAGGGVSLSGQSGVTSSSFSFEPSGGLAISGNSSIRGDWLARGGVSLSGESNVYVTRQMDGEGGVSMSGQADLVASSFDYTSSGGISLTGVADALPIISHTSSGGITLSGEASLERKFIASGGIRVLPLTLSDLITSSDAVGFWKFNESSGTVSDNLGTEGDSLDGEYVGPIDLGSPPIIQATTDTTIDLSAIDADRVLIPDSDFINTGGPYTSKSVEIWFLPTKSIYSSFNQNMPLWHQGVGGPSPAINDFGHGIWIDYGSNSVVNPSRGNYLDIWIYDSTTDVGVAEPWSIRLGGGFTPNAGGSALDFVANWDKPHQVVITFESNWPSTGATLKAYLNGELIGTQTTTKLARLYDDRGACTGCNPSGDRNLVGGHLGYVTQSGTASPKFFDGQLGYTAYWNSVLSTEDVSAHYNSGFYFYSMSIPAESDGGITLSGSSDLLRTTGVGVSVAGESDAGMTNISVEGSGGLVLAGDSIDQREYSAEASGGIILSGESETSLIIPVVPSGGILLSGQSGVTSNSFAFESSGGLVVSGSSSVRGDWVARGGVQLSGSANVLLTKRFTSSGGLSVSGESDYLISGFNYVSSGGVIISGDSNEGVKDYKYESSGGLSLSGFAESKWLIAFESSGGLLITENIFNKTVVVVDYIFTQDFQWAVQGEVYSFQNFQWDVGESPLMFYRVEGDCQQPDCENATFDDGETCTQGKRFFQTVVARSVSDVCEKLKQAYFSYPMIWPVKSIKRFSRPANLNVIRSQEAQGINHDCLELVEEEFCQIPECAEFCLSEQPQVFMGMNVTIQDTFFVYESVGGLFASATSGEVGFYSYESTGGIVASGSITTESSSWIYESNGEVVLLGNSDISSEFYAYIGSGSIGVSGTIANESSSYTFVASSGIFLEGSSVQEVALEFIPLFPLISTSGEASVSTGGFNYISSGGITLSGEANNLKNNHSYEGDGGLIISGDSEDVSSYVTYAGSGGLSASGEVLISRSIESTGDISVSGSSGFIIHYSYESLGGIGLSGNPVVISSSWSASGSGSMSMGGSAGVFSSFLGTLTAYIGAEAELTEEAASFPGIITGDTLTIDDGTVTTICGCDPLPLTLSLKQNLNKSTLLRSFSTLNDITFPDILTLRYDSLNVSWRENIQYTGIGIDGSSQERWTFLFEFTCNNNNFISEQTQTPNWKLSLYIKRKNLVSLEDYDARLLYTFSRDTVCVSDKLNFEFNIDVDSKVSYVSGNSPYVVDYEVFHDSMGFFVGGWQTDPELKIQISESVLSSGVRKVDIISLFPV